MYICRIISYLSVYAYTMIAILLYFVLDKYGFFFQYYHMTFQSIFKNGDVWVIKFVVGTWLVHDEIFHEYNETISTSAGCNHIEPIFYHALHIHLRS